MSTTPPAIHLHAATIGYGDVPIVRDVDLTVGAGEAVAVLGSNGSGKTTLARGLLGLATVLGGEVQVLGSPVGRLRERGRVGYVPQRHSITGAVPATVREVTGVGRLARLGLLRRLGAADRRAVADAVAAVGLADRLDDPVASLSGGQQRRVLVARALAAEPELLIMDEPTAGVDAASRHLGRRHDPRRGHPRDDTAGRRPLPCRRDRPRAGRLRRPTGRRRRARRARAPPPAGPGARRVPDGPAHGDPRPAGDLRQGALRWISSTTTSCSARCSPR